MNSSMKNSALMALPGVKEAISAGKVICIDKKPTRKPDFINLYLFAEIEGLGSGTAEMSQAAALFLGFTGSQQRCVQNAAKAFADTVQIGQTFDGLTFRCIDSVTPGWNTHTPRADSAGQIFFNNGKEIYRKFELVTKKELTTRGHVTLDVTSKGVTEPVQGVLATNLLEQAAQ